MNRAALLVLVVNFVVIGSLPVFFFRRDGRLNAMWWLTAGPFFLCPLILLAGFFRLIPGSDRFAAAWGAWHDLLAVPPSLASLALIFLTLGTHRIPIALWHQDNDAPRHIVTWGAYRRIRHPFYASFLLAFLAACLFFPHPIVLALAVCVFLVLNATAAREEKRLAASEFGDEYRGYLTRTGRFLPRWSRTLE